MIDDDIFQEEVEVSLRQATDGQLARIMQFIDRLPSRARLDAVVAPMRGRLALARPARSVTSARVLTVPIEHLLVDPACESASPFVLPRDILAIFHQIALEAVDPDELVILDDEAQGATMDDEAVVWRIGRRLWPIAAAALRQRLATPAAPDAEGWRPVHAEKFLVIAQILENVDELTPRLVAPPHCQVASAERDKHSRETAAALFARASAKSPWLGRCAAAISLRRLGVAQALRSLPPAGASDISDDGAIVAEAVDHCLTEAELTIAMVRQQPYSQPFFIAETATRLALLLVELRQTGANANNPAFAQRLASAIDNAQKQAALRFAGVLSAAESMFAEVADGSAGEDVVAQAEAIARAAAKISAACAILGGADAVAQVALQWRAAMGERLASAQRNASPSQGGPAIIDGVRLVEIVCGPDAAETLFDSLSAPPQRTGA